MLQQRGAVAMPVLTEPFAQVLGRLKLVTPETTLQRGDDGLFRSAGGDLPANPAARLQDGALEGSNVSPFPLSPVFTPPAGEPGSKK